MIYHGVKYTCEDCGGENVRLDYVINPNTGDGAETGDKAWCETCAEETGAGECWLKRTPCEPWGIEQRRERARWALKQYPEGNLTDLLTDLRHLADAEGLEFGKADQRSWDHWMSESEKFH